MIIISWNVRGAGKVECASTIRDLKKAYGIDVFAVLEPRIGGSRGLSVAKSLGFSHYHIVDPIGFSGGVWLLWNGNSVSLHVVAHSSQTVTALITMDSKRWLLTVVYASPCANVRTSLWKYFDGLAAVCNLPWLLLGVFNDIVCGEEKLGGNLDVGGQHFIEWIDRNHLIDLGFSGANFTWCNKRGEDDVIWKRLDRGLCNIDWRFLFSEAHLSHLPRVNSDHCPIMVKFFSNHLPATDSMPFRFQAMWLSHPSFSEFLSGLWNSSTGHAAQKSASLIWPLQRWNKQEGDRNTKFFHLSTIIRRRGNKLEGLTNDAGVWISEKEGMKQIVTHYFQGLFSEPSLSGEYSLLPQYFPQLERSECTRLNGEVSDVEIHSSLFAIGGLKTPGPDGFPALFFYQNYWDLCSKDILSLVKDCFGKASLPEHLNDTLIALVPKVERPLNMAQLRPISLCNTLYKVISKILVSRLRPIMTKIVSPTQVSFVPGRHIVDNIVIAQEMLHKFKVAKGQKGFIAWKIDLSKAYDRLSWSFIREVLCEIGIEGRRTLELIMHCISSVRYKAILNGELTADFSSKCGIRQGDPLSPYIFVLCMEKLSHIIQQKAVVMKQCLDDFCSLSGQKVSFEKSMVCVSPNTCPVLAQNIASISGSPLSNNLGKYLGVPIIHTRITKDTYQEIIDKVKKRLSSWKSHTLSMAGRLTLVQSVTSAIPIYSMQTAMLPASVCSKLDKLNKNFLWGHAADKAKVHLVNWETVCKSKCAGGLGVKKAAWMNQALLAKSGWRLLQNDQGLWAKVLKAKYLKNCDMLSVNEHQFRSCSSCWRGVLFGAKLLPSGVKWRVGYGDSILFWTDVWLSCGTLISHALIDLSEEMLHLNVSDFMEEGVWDVACLHECLPRDIVMMITSIHAGFIDSGPDMCIWRFTSNGNFSVNYFVQLRLVLIRIGSLFGGCICLRRLRPSFGFFVTRNSLLMLKGTVEFGSWFEDSSVLFPNFDDWLFHNLHSKRSFMTGLAWNSVFAVSLWFIWKWRCKFVFEHGFLLPSEPQQVILQYVKDWLAATMSVSAPLHQGVVYLHWQAPLPGRCKVNSDGSRKHARGYIGAGGLLRDQAGNWIKGFSVNLGVGSVIEAELWGIFWGLHLAWEDGFRTVEVECDSKSAVDLLLNPPSHTHPLFSITNCCYLLIQKEWCCSVKHIFREQNFAADSLAAMSHDLPLGLHILDSAPGVVVELLAADASSLARPRMSVL
ncbi:hypothetical protein L3X38_004119 [Prunus dulcis]|uniref:Reverse transcriptase domain-containing protein n=1 Tax=Prunus dulcis TaxID=3755 RepID=A0AAD5F2Y3_PRUDU|nr:hypothetical protein L3X38_004119 [Prunus dulcis]